MTVWHFLAILAAVAARATLAELIGQVSGASRPAITSSRRGTNGLRPLSHPPLQRPELIRYGCRVFGG